MKSRSFCGECGVELDNSVYASTESLPCGHDIRKAVARIVEVWRFSDGTTVELGGKVEGATLHAQRLRADLEQGVRVQIWPPPGGDVDLDVNDPALVNAWLENDLEWWRRVRGLSLSITERPKNIPALPPPPWADKPSDAPDDAVF